MTDTGTEHAHDHVIALVNQINNLLMGEDMAIAQTALTMTVVATIIHTAPTTEERLQQVRGFADQVAAYVQREDIVDWIKAGTIHLPQLHNKRQ